MHSNMPLRFDQTILSVLVTIDDPAQPNRCFYQMFGVQNFLVALALLIIVKGITTLYRSDIIGNSDHCSTPSPQSLLGWCAANSQMSSPLHMLQTAQVFADGLLTFRRVIAGRTDHSYF